MLTSGARTSVVHARPLTTRLEAGREVILCFCELAFYQGYRLGFTRMLAIETMPPQIEEIYRVVLEAQQQALAVVKPGERACQIDAIARGVMMKYGYGDYIAHRSGRGVGLDYVEKPEIRERDDTPLRPGMTFTVEPGIYIPGTGGARVEDSIVMTEKGYEELTPYPKEIRIA